MTDRGLVIFSARGEPELRRRIKRILADKDITLQQAMIEALEQWAEKQEHEQQASNEQAGQG